MELNDYQRAAAKIPRPVSVIHNLLALAEETGEVVAVARRHYFRNGHIDETREKLHEEIGDVLWCLAVIADEHGLNLGSIAISNLAKLTERHGNGSAG